MTKAMRTPNEIEVDAARLRALLPAVERAVRDLPAAELAVLRWRYGFGARRHTQRDIACRLKLSIGAVRRLERRALRTLRALSLPVDLPRCRTAPRDVFPPRRPIGTTTTHAAHAGEEPAQLTTR